MIGIQKVSRTTQLRQPLDFESQTTQLLLVERQPLEGATRYFDALMKYSFGVAGKVSKNNAQIEIKKLLDSVIPEFLLINPFYQTWVHDMAEVCEMFCDLQEHNAVGFWLGTERSCGRYHVDNVPMRALVTYSGRGTEYLPDYAANRMAYENGESNDMIVKDKTAIQFMQTWDVGIFRGGPKGMLHRSPDVAMNGASVMMRLDYPTYWDQFPNYKKMA